jgi:hypothetical protein
VGKQHSGKRVPKAKPRREFKMNRMWRVWTSSK